MISDPDPAVGPSPGPSPEPRPDTAAAARDYEAIHNRLFAVRIALTLLLLASYLFSGASAGLADGLRSWFGSAWWLVNAVYVLVTMVGFAAFTFPLSLYGDYLVEQRFGLSRQRFGGWLWDYAKGLALELVLTMVFFGVVYAFLRWTPGSWWAWATGFYILFAVVLAALGPVVIMPLFHKFEPLEESDLTQSVRRFVEQSGLKVVGVYRWGLSEKTVTANAALAGLGRTRRIILGDTMLTGYSRDEVIAVLAHEVGHYKHRDILRMMAVGSLLATAGFYLAHVCLRALVARLGFAGVDDIGSFPVFLLILFLFSLLVMPVANGYSRRREFAADAYAVKAIGTAAPLTGALEKLAAQNLADRAPARWIEFLLHSHPSIDRRVRRAKQVEGAGP
ncbi:MAG: M48 family metallopeptidase [Kiritimatiellae bacterium]|nr:M48 family metallopeptidase [Kiritimatiellia bacterium]